jgi:hypothetical protein
MVVAEQEIVKLRSPDFGHVSQRLRSLAEMFGRTYGGATDTICRPRKAAEPQLLRAP